MKSTIYFTFCMIYGGLSWLPWVRMDSITPCLMDDVMSQYYGFPKGFDCRNRYLMSGNLGNDDEYLAGLPSMPHLEKHKSWQATPGNKPVVSPPKENPSVPVGHEIQVVVATPDRPNDDPNVRDEAILDTMIRHMMDSVQSTHPHHHIHHGPHHHIHGKSFSSRTDVVSENLPNHLTLSLNNIKRDSILVNNKRSSEKKATQSHSKREANQKHSKRETHQKQSKRETHQRHSKREYATSHAKRDHLMGAKIFKSHSGKEY